MDHLRGGRFNVAAVYLWLTWIAFGIKWEFPSSQPANISLPHTFLRLFFSLDAKGGEKLHELPHELLVLFKLMTRLFSDDGEKNLCWEKSPAEPELSRVNKPYLQHNNL